MRKPGQKEGRAGLGIPRCSAVSIFHAKHEFKSFFTLFAVPAGCCHSQELTQHLQIRDLTSEPTPPSSWSRRQRFCTKELQLMFSDSGDPVALRLLIFTLDPPSLVWAQVLSSTCPPDLPLPLPRQNDTPALPAWLSFGNRRCLRSPRLHGPGPSGQSAPGCGNRSCVVSQALFCLRVDPSPGVNKEGGEQRRNR